MQFHSVPQLLGDWCRVDWIAGWLCDERDRYHYRSSFVANSVSKYDMTFRNCQVAQVHNEAGLQK